MAKNMGSVNSRGTSGNGGRDGRSGSKRGPIRMPSETIDRRKNRDYRAGKCTTYISYDLINTKDGSENGNPSHSK